MLTLTKGLSRAFLRRKASPPKDPDMPDFWDKLFKTNLSTTDPTYSVNGVSAAVYLYAIGSVTKGAAGALILDDHGNPPPAGELAQATLLLDSIDAQSGSGVVLEFNKLREAQKVGRVLDLVELGWTDKDTAKSFLGV